MLHEWSSVADKPGTVIRTELFDFRKDFENLIHHKTNKSQQNFAFGPFYTDQKLDFKLFDQYNSVLYYEMVVCLNGAIFVLMFRKELN